MNQESMDAFAHSLVGQTVGGWTLVRILGVGGSAAVLEGRHADQIAAVKVYSPNAGLEEEAKTRARVARTLAAANKPHPHLIAHYDGGACATTGLLFVAMQLVDGGSLAHAISSFPVSNARLVISQVAAAARHLEEALGLAHRDIKPANIAINEQLDRATLLDLGVVRPLVETSDLTDTSKRPFIATRRYAPPEFLARRESPTIEAWRAITFYQLGGVLHDMLTRSKLFARHTDHDALVHAIATEIPVIAAPEAPSDLVRLASDCLHKDPDVRLRRVDWVRFENDPASTAVDRRLRRVRETKPRRDWVRAVELDADHGLEQVVEEVRGANIALNTPQFRIVRGTPTNRAFYVDYGRSSRTPALIKLRIWFVVRLEGDAATIEAAAVAYQGDAPAVPAALHIVYADTFDQEMVRARVHNIIASAFEFIDNDLTLTAERAVQIPIDDEESHG